MRDPNRIPKILAHLERIWTANPDFRLGQLIMMGTERNQPCPGVFYIEDDQLVEGLLGFEERFAKLKQDRNDAPA